MRIDELHVHPYAQRDIVPSNLKRLVAEMDLDAIGVLHAVEYDERGLLVIDGQHRMRALMEHQFGEWQVEVKVHLDIKTDKEASDKFLKLNKRAPVSPFHTYTNELKAGYPEAVGSYAVVQKCGFKVGPTNSDGHLRCVNVLKKVYRLDSKGEVLHVTLNIVKEAWGFRRGGLEGTIVEGLAVVVHRFAGAIDIPALSMKLSKYAGGPTGLLGNARGLASHRKNPIARCVADLVVETYNRGRSKKLEVAS